jgi:hypothetical protein
MPTNADGLAALNAGGCDARVARVATDGRPGLARSTDCAAQCATAARRARLKAE